MKLWNEKTSLNKFIEEFTIGDDYLLDRKLVKYDCIGSIVHVKMLCKQKIISNGDCKKIVKELKNLIDICDSHGIKIERSCEDCHTFIESYLVEKIGDIGKKVHTARSRNDQVLTALRLYYKDELDDVVTNVDNLIVTLNEFKEKNGQTPLPGFTHTRKAMPSNISTWSGCFIESMEDNKKILSNVFDLINQSPLGSGAGYGVPFDLNREYTTELLGFKRKQKNPIYVQNSRGKFESMILSVLNMIMFDLNKISSDLILFSIPAFGYFVLDERVCTGSSIMPHKKNPDVLEIIRANYFRVLSKEFEVKNIIGNLISGYNRDLQLTKKPVFEGFKITKNSLNAMQIVFQNLKVDKKNCKKAMTEELYSVEKVADLVKKGVSFREAYKQVSKD